MPTEVQEHESAHATESSPRRRGLIVGGVVLLVAVAVLAVVLGAKWPFTPSKITHSLQQQSGGVVEVKGWKQMYFPPGCVADGVTFRRGKDGPVFLTIRRLAITGSYPGLLTHHISTIRAEGLHLVIAHNGTSTPPGGGIGTTTAGLSIGQIVADGAEIEFPGAEPDQQSLVFRIPKLVLKDVADRHPLSFQTTVKVPNPAAEVDVSGKFGPWQSDNAGQTRLSGTYSLKKLDLGTFGGVAGVLAASGNFEGRLDHVAIEGTVDVPKFEVRSSGHPDHLAAQFDATVNGLHGDVDVDAVRAHFRRTTIEGAGSVSGEAGGKGKVAKFQLSSSHARIEDLLWMFVSTEPPDMAGAIVFRADAVLPPEQRPFLKRLRLEGEFGVSHARYPHPETQRKIDVLSARARGEADKVEDAQEKTSVSIDPGRVLSNLKANVDLRNETAHLSHVSFDMPGASALLDGTYNLQTQRVDLHGTAKIDTQLSKATTGVKSVLLKLVKPFMKKSKNKESVVAIRMGGTYRHPTFTAIPVAAK